MAILSYLSFRNIQNENYLIQKNFDENRISLQKELEDALEKEQGKIFQETKAASLFLYEQPKSLLEFGNAANFKDVQALMGHSDISITLNIYSHVNPETQRKAVDIFERAVN